MPGPGPRGPRQTYRAPCSSILDSRISARNPRKTGNSRAARGTRIRQPGMRSTRDGLLFVKSGCKHRDPRPSRPSSRATGPGFFRPFLWFLPKIAKKPQNPVAKSGTNFQQKIANWRISASFAKFFLGSRTGSRPLPSDFRRTDRQIRQGPRPIGSDRWPSIIGSAPAIRRAHTRPAGCKGHVSDK